MNLGVAAGQFVAANQWVLIRAAGWPFTI